MFTSRPPLPPLAVCPDPPLHAQSLWERLAVVSETDGRDAANHEDRATARLRAWQRTIAGSSEAAFARRFVWDGYALDDARRVLRAETPPRNDAALAWLSVFHRILGRDGAALRARYARLEAAPPDPVLNPDDPLPFERLFVPFVRHARQRLRQAAGPAYELLTLRPRVQLERYLVARLSRICADVLYAAFSDFKEAEGKAAEAERAGAAFLKRMQRGAFYALLQAHPVAARLCVRVTELWIDAYAAFLQRLARDWEALGRLCPDVEGSFEKVTDVGVGLSDPHEGGRSVVIVTFDGRCRVVYKPRPIGLERYFAGLQHWVNAQGGLQPLRPFRLLARETYGWVEFVALASCPDPAAVHRFYQRCGMLLCLVYLTGGTDFHRENLIAMGEHPMLIDMEALFRPGAADEDEAAAMDGLTWAGHRFTHSVFWTEMLPFYHFARGGAAALVGAMGEAAGELPDAGRPANLPRLGDEAAPAADGAEAVVAGFRHTYRLLMRHRPALLRPGSPLRQAGGCLVRYLYRNTGLYARMLRLGCQARYLRDGLDRSILLDSLSRVLISAEERPLIWPVVAAERAALEQMDVPSMHTRVDSRDLLLSNGVVLHEVFHTTPLEAMQRRLRQMDEADLAFQVRVIRDSLYGYRAKGLRPPVRSKAEAALPPAPPLTPGRALAAAVALGEVVCRHASHAPGGEALWFGLNYVAAARRYSAGPLNAGLFSGSSGLVLFLAALARASGQPRFEEEARRGANGLRGWGRAFEEAVDRERGLESVATFCGPLLYTLAHLAHFLDDDTFLNDALRLALRLDARVFEKTPTPGVIGGTAGCILGLLAMHRATGEAALLERARQAGRHLLAHRQTDPATGLLVWPVWKGRAEAGFAHGAAGLVYTLLRLYEAGGEAAFAEAARIGWAYVEAARDPARPGKDPALAGSWGLGLAGYGLAGLLVRTLLPEAAAVAACEAALAGLSDHQLAAHDTLAAGTFGQIDVLLTAARVLDRPALEDRARAAAGQAVAAAQARGHYRTGWRGNPNLGFMTGLAGIGYLMLRLRDPAAHPSVPAMAPPASSRRTPSLF